MRASRQALVGGGHAVGHVGQAACCRPGRAPAGATQQQRRRPAAARAQQRDGGGAPRGSTSEWLIPDRLLQAGARASRPKQPQEAAQQEPQQQPQQQAGGASTVYTLRLSTSWDRGAALSEPMAGVNVCLISKDGDAVLHRIPPLNDPQGHLQVMQDICGSGEDVGADCSILSSEQQPSWPAGKEPAVKQRFQEGAVDEVSFMAPELGSLAAVLLAPEGGSWVCDEVHVSSSRTNHTDRFVCRTRLGGRKGEPAAYLTPVPPGAVVYGTGESARVITQEQAAALQRASLSDYSALKSRLLLTTALLTAGGSGVAALASGADAAVPFALGGLAGLVYQLLLQLGADAAVPSAPAGASSSAAVRAFSAAAARSGGGGSGGAAASSEMGAGPGPSSSPASGRGVSVPFVPRDAAVLRAGGRRQPYEEAAQERLRARALQLVGSAAFRLALLTAAALLAVWALQDGGGAPGGPNGGSGEPASGLGLGGLHLRPVDAWQLAIGLCGFMMQKVAVLGAALTAPPGPSDAHPEPAQRVQRNA